MIFKSIYGFHVENVVLKHYYGPDLHSHHLQFSENDLQNQF